MKVTDSRKALLSRLKADGRSLSGLTAADGLAAVFAFYAEVRAERCRLDEDGDMLLYQWGEGGTGRHTRFELDLTRQFLLPNRDEPFQLSLTFHYPITPALRKLGDGNAWCPSPDELPAFRKKVERSAAYRAVKAARPRKVELDFGES